MTLSASGAGVPKGASSDASNSARSSTEKLEPPATEEETEEEPAATGAEMAATEEETEADDKLNKFLESHPEGFHYTFRSKDGKVVRDYDYRTKKYDVFDGYNLLQEAFNNFNKLLNF